MFLTGCGSVEDDFINILNSDNEKHICLDQGSAFGVTLWGEEKGDQYLMNIGIGYSAKKEGDKMLLKFAAKGFVDPKPKNVRYQFQRHNVYKLTDKGRKYYKWGEPICIGDRSVTYIIEYTEPAEKDGKTITHVKFTYTVKWNEIIRELELEEGLQKEVEESNNEGQAVFVKTNKGWRLVKG